MAPDVIRRPGLVAWGALVLTLALGGTALAHDCSSPADCEQTAGYNAVLAIAGGIIAIGAGVFASQVVRGEDETDPCLPEKRREATARARRDAARQRQERIRQLREAADRARQELERAESDHTRLTDERTTSWYQKEPGGPRIYTNKDHAASVQRAEAALAAARAANDAAKGAYDGAGDGSEESAAQEALDAAQREWEEANAALQECLGQNAPPPAPEPSGGTEGGTTPPDGGGTTPPEGGTVGGTTTRPAGGGTEAPPPTPPTIATTPPPIGTTTRPPAPTCPEGTEQERSGSSATSQQVTFADLRNAKIRFSSDTRQVTDFPLDDFIDWAQFSKDTFFALRKVKGLAEGLGPDAGVPVGGALDVAGFPDFLTYYDKMIGEVLKRLKETGEIQARVAKNGDYWLEYTKKKYTLRCEPWERCSGGRWVPFSKFSMTFDGEEAGQTRRVQATGDHRSIGRLAQRAIDAGFRELESMNARAERQANTAKENCR